MYVCNVCTYVRTYVCMYVRLRTYLLICVQNIQARIYRGNMNKLDATEPLSITPGRRGEATQLKLVGVFEAPQPTIPLCESHSTSHITKKKRCSTMQCARNMAEKLKAAIGNPKGFVANISMRKGCTCMYLSPYVSLELCLGTIALQTWLS